MSGSSCSLTAAGATAPDSIDGELEIEPIDSETALCKTNAAACGCAGSLISSSRHRRAGHSRFRHRYRPEDAPARSSAPFTEAGYFSRQPFLVRP